MKGRFKKTSRGMLPIYRDVHPDRCPVDIYGKGGAVLISADVDSRLVETLDEWAAENGVSFQRAMRRIILKAGSKKGSKP